MTVLQVADLAFGYAGDTLFENVTFSLAVGDRVALVAEGAQSSIAGFLVAVLIPPEAELESIAVDAASQRRGIARQLFAALVQELRARCVDILLEVRPSNQAGRAFYAALGFVETARRPAYYADPVEDAILMRLAIPAKPPDWLQMPHSS